MANENIKLDEGIGSVRIADEVVSIIAGMAATEVDGIAGMSGGLVGGIAEILGKKNLAKGVKVEVGDTEAAVDLYIIVKFGVRIPDVALTVQEKVKNAIESMTGLSVVEVNVHVQGVGFPETEAKEEEAHRKQARSRGQDAAVPRLRSPHNGFQMSEVLGQIAGRI